MTSDRDPVTREPQRKVSLLPWLALAVLAALVVASLNAGIFDTQRKERADLSALEDSIRALRQKAVFVDSLCLSVMILRAQLTRLTAIVSLQGGGSLQSWTVTRVTGSRWPSSRILLWGKEF